MRFTDFRVSVSCRATRSMLLTGTDNNIAGLGRLGELPSDNQRGKPGYFLIEAIRANRGGSKPLLAYLSLQQHPDCRRPKRIAM